MRIRHLLTITALTAAIAAPAMAVEKTITVKCPTAVSVEYEIQMIEGEVATRVEPVPVGTYCSDHANLVLKIDGAPAFESMQDMMAFLEWMHTAKIRQ